MSKEEKYIFRKERLQEYLIKMKVKRVPVVFLPPYPPILNPIEKVFGNIKRKMLMRVFQNMSK